MGSILDYLRSCLNTGLGIVVLCAGLSTLVPTGQLYTSIGKTTYVGISLLITGSVLIIINGYKIYSSLKEYKSKEIGSNENNKLD